MEDTETSKRHKVELESDSEYDSESEPPWDDSWRYIWEDRMDYGCHKEWIDEGGHVSSIVIMSFFEPIGELSMSRTGCDVFVELQFLEE